MSAVQRYNGFRSEPSQYVWGVGDKLVRLADGQYGDFDGFNKEYAKALGEKFKSAYSERVTLYSPAQLYVYNSEGAVTGLVNGEVREEIPNSFYDAGAKTIVILLPSEHHNYTVVGEEEGTYGLTAGWFDQVEAVEFRAVGVPTAPRSVHRYTVDWDGLSQGDAAITIEKDYNGDGVVDEYIVTSLPEAPGNPYPQDNSTQVPLDEKLSWSGYRSDSTTFNIHLGTAIRGLQLVSERQTETTFAPALEPNTIYYWSVTAINEHNIAKEGPVWVFATGESGLPFMCFIATAAYGEPMAEEIQVLREFRDGYLLTNSLGRAFVDLYYRTSPPIAQFITDHPGLKPIVRAAVVPAVAMSTAAVNTTPIDKTAVVGLLVVSVAVAVWVTRRRHRHMEHN